MKKLVLFLSLFAQYSFGQVFNGSQEIDKTKREGAYILTNSDLKFVEKSWQNHLTIFGKQNTSKGGITIINAKAEGISTELITLYSKVWKQSDRTHIFLSALLPNGDIVTNGHEKWGELEKILIDYQSKLSLEEAVRSAENEQNTAMENHKKIVKNGDKLKDRIEDNKKEKEKLLKKIEENRVELEKLLTDVETNKKDQSKALDEIEIRKRGVDEAKSKLPK
ncbi:MAG: hypothetical protein V4683_17885 [Bacteroidota bacterium]